MAIAASCQHTGRFQTCGPDRSGKACPRARDASPSIRPSRNPVRRAPARQQMFSGEASGQMVIGLYRWDSTARIGTTEQHQRQFQIDALCEAVLREDPATANTPST